MAKGGKSSASSGTRKKHAKRATDGRGDEPPMPKEKKPKGKDKKNKEPRKKEYIPPVKPTPIRPDPLDGLGLAHQLPPELVVVLRRLAKKDTVTKTRALEELQSLWLMGAKRATGNEDDAVAQEMQVSALVTMVPVWLHHAPVLFLHPNRRLRLLATGVHGALLHFSDVRQSLFSTIIGSEASSDVQQLLGTWCMVTQDAERVVATAARRTWEDAFIFTQPLPSQPSRIRLESAIIEPILSFVMESILDPTHVYARLNPPPPVANPPPKPPGKKGHAPPPLTPPTRTKEEEEESEEDRMARLRIGAMGVVQWLLDSAAKTSGMDKSALWGQLEPILSRRVVWTTLHSTKVPTTGAGTAISLGYQQPGVRKAGWSLLYSWLRNLKDSMDSLVPILAIPVLRSAWIEPDISVRATMWEPLLKFLTSFPRAWEVDAQCDTTASRSQAKEGSDDEDGDGSDEEDEDEEEEAEPSTSSPAAQDSGSSSYRAFLQFLELGCAGSPVQGYPTIIIILSTLPSSVLGSDPLPSLFTSFWAAIDGRALTGLDRAVAHLAFLTSILECTIFLVRRIRSGKDDPPLVQANEDSPGGETLFVEEQIARIVEGLVAGRLLVEEQAAGKALADCFVSLNAIDSGLFNAGWAQLSKAARDEFASTESTSVRTDRVFSLIRGCIEGFPTDNVALCSATRNLLLECTQIIIDQTERALQTDTPALVPAHLSIVLTQFGTIVGQDEVLSSRVHKCVASHAKALLTRSPALIFAYLSWCPDPVLLQSTWHLLLDSVAMATGESTPDILQTLLRAVKEGQIPSSVRPSGEQLDRLASDMLTRALIGWEEEELADFIALLRHYEFFISETTAQGLLRSVNAVFAAHWTGSMQSILFHHRDLIPPMRILSDLLNGNPNPQFIIDSDPDLSTFADICLLGYLPSRMPNPEAVAEQARITWMLFAVYADFGDVREAHGRIWSRLSEIMQTVRYNIDSRDVLEFVFKDIPALPLANPQLIFANPLTYNRLLRDIPRTPIHSSIGVLQELLPASFEVQTVPRDPIDVEGCSGYARLVLGFLRLCHDHREYAKSNVWALRHLLVLAEHAKELAAVPTAPSPLFHQFWRLELLQEIQTKTNVVASYLLTVSVEEAWHTRTVAAISDASKRAGLDDVAILLCDLFDQAKEHDSLLDSMVVRTALTRILSGAGKNEADQWMLLCRQLETKYPQTSLAVLDAVTRFGAEPPRLDRYRNELAANIFGVKSSKANTEGVLFIRRLAASAPDRDSDVIFLPQNRALNLVKTCQQWLASDEDIDPEVEIELIRMFDHITPILQSLPGSHWDLMFDLVETNLEEASLLEDSSLVVLTRCLRLILTLEELTETNRALRDVWYERRNAILAMVKTIVVKDTGTESMSAPRSHCREQALEVLRRLPESLIDHETISEFCHLMLDKSTFVQKIAYDLLRKAAARRTEYLVVEAALEEGLVKAELPHELIDLIQQSANETSHQHAFAQCLGWMTIFNLFENTSLKVKTSYVEQLRNLDLVSSNFLPFVFELLDLSGTSASVKPFKLDIWAVDEFYYDLSDPSEPRSLTLFAAHLYYRALLIVPSLIRTWWLECKDRQLSTTVATYTSQYFSPVIIDTELSHVRSSSTELSDENMKIKVSNAISEIAATYTVDEHDIEIAIKIPPDFPLRVIDVREVRKAGIQDNRWRGWMFGVQQTISSQNGRIADGLSLFKKNLGLHFEGQTECAICYSIIAVTDGSLPTKPCKTCKNRFHASCLYKWFNTSHASNCPLCRSDIL